MNRLSLYLAILFIGSSLAASRAADRAPGISIEQALKIAQDFLKSASDADSRSIVALTLEESTIRGGGYWYAKWSSPIYGGAKPQLGLRIEMDGSLAKIVSGGPAPSVGMQRFGARNIR